MADRTAREVVGLNLFVAIQAALDLASHWIADAGWPIPEAYGDAFRALAERGVIDPALAQRLRGAAGLRNFIAHQYGGIDWERVHRETPGDLADLEALAQALSKAAGFG